MSFARQTTKTEPIKSLQHFALFVKFYINVISTQNVVNFERHILPYFVLSNESLACKWHQRAWTVFFVIISFIRKDKEGKICLQTFTTFCVDITFLYILTFNAKCCILVTSSVFVVRFVNDIVEFELSFLKQCFSLKRPNEAKYVFKNL